MTWTLSCPAMVQPFCQDAGPCLQRDSSLEDGGSRKEMPLNRSRITRIQHFIYRTRLILWAFFVTFFSFRKPVVPGLLWVTSHQEVACDIIAKEIKLHKHVPERVESSSAETERGTERASFHCQQLQRSWCPAQPTALEAGFHQEGPLCLSHYCLSSGTAPHHAGEGRLKKDGQNEIPPKAVLFSLPHILLKPLPASLLLSPVGEPEQR
ncbi:PREDICTED: uncharacterized protein LOC108509577 [Lepidothrix coronata]|uniref:Uncharacterized protein LOC108509577 n=1 Tax=Lepidothrix coronata TaxID=321398 RepID=A0A6J0J6K9_9PASS|nr:PREDICTED: uncharacterized protein LOC108509577 [Lepidothrix coronata]